MAKKKRGILKSCFETGKRPTQEQFENLIDSGLNFEDDGLQVDDGNIGIGTPEPQVKLHVAGGTELDLDEASGYLILGNASGKHLAFDSNEIMAKKNDGEATNLYLQYHGGGVVIGGARGAGAGPKLQVRGTSDVNLEEEPSGLLIVGNASGKHLALDKNEIMAKAKAKTADNLYLQAQGGNVGIGIPGRREPKAPLNVDGGTNVDLQGASGYLILGNASGEHLAMDSNEIMAKANAKTADNLYLQYQGGDVFIGGSDGAKASLHLTDGALILGGDDGIQLNGKPELSSVGTTSKSTLWISAHGMKAIGFERQQIANMAPTYRIVINNEDWVFNQNPE